MRDTCQNWSPLWRLSIQNNPLESPWKIAFKKIVKFSWYTHGLNLIKQAFMSNLVKTLNISKNTDLTSKDGLQSNASNISWVTASNWFMQEWSGRKPDWFGLIDPPPTKNYRFYWILFFQIFYHRWAKERSVGSY